MQEVLEEPSAENGHRALWKPPLRAPNVVRLAKAADTTPSLEADGAAAAAKAK
jgi:hypothetical protein